MLVKRAVQKLALRAHLGHLLVENTIFWLVDLHLFMEVQQIFNQAQSDFILFAEYNRQMEYVSG